MFFTSVPVSSLLEASGGSLQIQDEQNTDGFEENSFLGLSILLWVCEVFLDLFKEVFYQDQDASFSK